MGNKVFLPIGLNEKDLSFQFYSSLSTHPQQKRPTLVWDECLARAANIRAIQVSVEFDHCYLANCVNRIVRKNCPLPPEYPENGNSIESLIGGVKDPNKALELLLNSPKHADHLLGRVPFFHQQSRVGIAFYFREQSKYKYYYCILISK